MLLLDNDAGGFVAVDYGLGDRVRARLAADRIDRALAGGRSPDAGIALAVRAQALASAATRRDLAQGLARALGEARKPSTARIIHVRVNRAQVLAAVPELEELHRRLLSGGPVSVRGVALVKELLTCGTGPMYWRSHPGDLGSQVRRAIDALDVIASSDSARR
jgi:hypothetical protein